MLASRGAAASSPSTTNRIGSAHTAAGGFNGASAGNSSTSASRRTSSAANTGANTRKVSFAVPSSPIVANTKLSGVRPSSASATLSGAPSPSRQRFDMLGTRHDVGGGGGSGGGESPRRSGMPVRGSSAGANNNRGLRSDAFGDSPAAARARGGGGGGYGGRPTSPPPPPPFPVTVQQQQCPHPHYPSNGAIHGALPAELDMRLDPSTPRGARSSTSSLEESLGQQQPQPYGRAGGAAISATAPSFLAMLSGPSAVNQGGGGRKPQQTAPVPAKATAQQQHSPLAFLSNIIATRSTTLAGGGAVSPSAGAAAAAAPVATASGLMHVHVGSGASVTPRGTAAHAPLHSDEATATANSAAGDMSARQPSPPPDGAKPPPTSAAHMMHGRPHAFGSAVIPSSGAASSEQLEKEKAPAQGGEHSAVASADAEEGGLEASPLPVRPVGSPAAEGPPLPAPAAAPFQRTLFGGAPRPSPPPAAPPSARPTGGAAAGPTKASSVPRGSSTHALLAGLNRAKPIHSIGGGGGVRAGSATRSSGAHAPPPAFDADAPLSHSTNNADTNMSGGGASAREEDTPQSISAPPPANSAADKAHQPTTLPAPSPFLTPGYGAASRTASNLSTATNSSIVSANTMMLQRAGLAVVDGGSGRGKGAGGPLSNNTNPPYRSSGSSGHGGVVGSRGGAMYAGGVYGGGSSANLLFTARQQSAGARRNVASTASAAAASDDDYDPHADISSVTSGGGGAEAPFSSADQQRLAQVTAALRTTAALEEAEAVERRRIKGSWVGFVKRSLVGPLADFYLQEDAYYRRDAAAFRAMHFEVMQLDELEVRELTARQSLYQQFFYQQELLGESQFTVLERRLRAGIAREYERWLETIRVFIHSPPSEQAILEAVCMGSLSERAAALIIDYHSRMGHLDEGAFVVNGGDANNNFWSMMLKRMRIVEEGERAKAEAAKQHEAEAHEKQERLKRAMYRTQENIAMYEAFIKNYNHEHPNHRSRPPPFKVAVAIDRKINNITPAFEYAVAEKERQRQMKRLAMLSERLNAMALAGTPPATAAAEGGGASPGVGMAISLGSAADSLGGGNGGGTPGRQGGRAMRPASSPAYRSLSRSLGLTRAPSGGATPPPRAPHPPSGGRGLHQNEDDVYEDEDDGDDDEQHAHGGAGKAAAAAHNGRHYVHVPNRPNTAGHRPPTVVSGAGGGGGGRYYRRPSSAVNRQAQSVAAPQAPTTFTPSPAPAPSAGATPSASAARAPSTEYLDTFFMPSVPPNQRQGWKPTSRRGSLTNPTMAAAAAAANAVGGGPMITPAGGALLAFGAPLPQPALSYQEELAEHIRGSSAAPPPASGGSLGRTESSGALGGRRNSKGSTSQRPAPLIDILPTGASSSSATSSALGGGGGGAQQQQQQKQSANGGGGGGAMVVGSASSARGVSLASGVGGGGGGSLSPSPTSTVMSSGSAVVAPISKGASKHVEGVPYFTTHYKDLWTSEPLASREVDRSPRHQPTSRPSIVGRRGSLLAGLEVVNGVPPRRADGGGGGGAPMAHERRDSMQSPDFADSPSSGGSPNNPYVHSDARVLKRIDIAEEMGQATQQPTAISVTDMDTSAAAMVASHQYVVPSALFEYFIEQKRAFDAVAKAHSERRRRVKEAAIAREERECDAARSSFFEFKQREERRKGLAPVDVPTNANWLWYFIFFKDVTMRRHRLLSPSSLLMASLDLSAARDRGGGAAAGGPSFRNARDLDMSGWLGPSLELAASRLPPPSPTPSAPSSSATAEEEDPATAVLNALRRGHEGLTRRRY